MEFKNSVSILFSNIGYVFKLMLWMLISLAVTAGVGAAIFVPLWRVVSASTDVMAHVHAIQLSLAEVWEGALNMRVAVKSLVPELIAAINSLGQAPGALAGMIVGTIFCYALYCFLRGMSFYTLSDIINKLMAFNMRYGFASNMALNLRKNALFSICRLAISLPIDLVYGVILISCSLVFYELIGLFTMPIMLVFSIIFCSFRAVLFSGWLPRLLYHPEERIFPAFSRSLVYVKHNLTDFFKAYATIFTIVYILLYLCTIPTGGLSAIVLMPTHYILLRTVELIGYYKAKGLSFYTDGSNVVNTVEYGRRLANQEPEDAAERTDERSMPDGESASADAGDKE